jgi:hypothetical protein
MHQLLKVVLILIYFNEKLMGKLMNEMAMLPADAHTMVLDAPTVERKKSYSISCVNQLFSLVILNPIYLLATTLEPWNIPGTQGNGSFEAFVGTMFQYFLANYICICPYVLSKYLESIRMIIVFRI